jgi:hypothetical protein
VADLLTCAILTKSGKRRARQDIRDGVLYIQLGYGQYGSFAQIRSDQIGIEFLSRAIKAEIAELLSRFVCARARYVACPMKRVQPMNVVVFKEAQHSLMAAVL